METSKPTPAWICRQTGILFVLSVASVLCFGQEQTGISQSNFSGSQGFEWNPASAVAGPLNWDVGLINAHVFAANNYLYIPSASWASLPNEDVEPVYNDERSYRAAAFADLRGPSFMFRIGNRTAVGAFTAARNHVRAKGVDTQLGHVNYQNLSIGQVTAIDPFQAAVLTWAEAGLHLSYVLLDDASGTLSAGLNLRYLSGFEALHVLNGTGATITRNQDGSLSIDNADLSLAYTGNPGEDYSFDGSRGAGWGLDLGFEFRSPDYTGGAEPNRNGFRYGWKIGAALVDLGSIRMTQEALQYKVTGPFGTESANFSSSEFDGAGSLSEAIAVLEAEFAQLDSAGVVQSGNECRIGLPAGLTLHADRHLGQDFYLAIFTSRGLPTFGNSLKRTPVIGLSPRYERKWFEASLPVSLVDDEDLRMGLSIRLGWLTVGTDDLLSMVVPGKLDGGDAYVGLKINDFCSGGSGRRGSRGTGCPAFY